MVVFFFYYWIMYVIDIYFYNYLIIYSIENILEDKKYRGIYVLLFFKVFKV